MLNWWRCHFLKIKGKHKYNPKPAFVSILCLMWWWCWSSRRGFPNAKLVECTIYIFGSIFMQSAFRFPEHCDATEEWGNNEATSSCVVWEVKDLIKWIPSWPSWPSSTATPIQSVNPWKSCTCSSSPPFLDNPWYTVRFSTWTSSSPFSGYLSVGVSKNLIFLKIEQKRWNMAWI